MIPVKPDVSFPKIEEEILADWDKQEVFKEQDKQRESAKQFSFYDGPLQMAYLIMVTY